MFQGTATFEASGKTYLCKLGMKEAMEFEKIRNKSLVLAILKPLQSNDQPQFLDVNTLLALALRHQYGRKSTPSMMAALQDRDPACVDECVLAAIRLVFDFRGQSEVVEAMDKAAAEDTPDPLADEPPPEQPETPTTDSTCEPPEAQP